MSFSREYYGTNQSKLITSLVMLNRNIAISQFYQFKMIAHYSGFEIPEEGCAHCAQESGIEHTHDPIDDKKRLILKRYMLNNLEDFFDLDKYFKLMKLSLEFDPNNEFVSDFGMHLSLNNLMISKCINVFSEVYNIHPSWNFAFNNGWLYYYCLKDSINARLWLKRAMELNPSHFTIKNVYDATFSLDKKYDAAIEHVRQRLADNTNHEMISILEKKLKWFEGLSYLLKKSVEYKQIYNKDINSLEDLISSKLIETIPSDPIGSGFYWDSETQDIISKNSPYEKMKSKNALEIHTNDIDEEDFDSH
ncbi:MAG: hypothetical protein ACD_79C01446G0005 [uncultured bacterium]|nr:MAG: hypothetical protein ACD_79C01446G0005 [uncultured bacterium]